MQVHVQSCWRRVYAQSHRRYPCQVAATARPRASRSASTETHAPQNQQQGAAPTSIQLPTLTLTALTYLASEASAWAMDEAGPAAGIAYSGADGGEYIKNAAGGAYVLLVGVFLYRVLARRAKRAREQKVSGQPLPFQSLQPEESWFDKMREKLSPKGQEQQREATAFDAFLGAAQAGVLGFGLFIFSTKVAALVNVQQLPEAYTARNISITVRTLIQGLSWLATFIFSANAVGLLGLSVQMLLYPESLKADEADRAARRAAAEAAGPQLPKVAITANNEEVKRAFQAAESMGRREGAKEVSAIKEAAILNEASSSSSASSDGSN